MSSRTVLPRPLTPNSQLLVVKPDSEVFLCLDRSMACLFDADFATSAVWDDVIGLLNKKGTPPWVAELDKWFIPIAIYSIDDEEPPTRPLTPPLSWPEPNDAPGNTALAESVKQRSARLKLFITLKHKTKQQVIAEAKRGYCEPLKAWYRVGWKLSPETPRIIADNAVGIIKKPDKKPTRSDIENALRSINLIVDLVVNEIRLFLKDYYPEQSDRAIAKKAFTLASKELGRPEYWVKRVYGRGYSPKSSRLMPRFYRLPRLDGASWGSEAGPSPRRRSHSRAKNCR